MTMFGETVNAMAPISFKRMLLGGPRVRVRRGHQRAAGAGPLEQRVGAAADHGAGAVRRQEGRRPLRRQTRHGAHRRRKVKEQIS